MKIKVGINGMGRIGRMIVRSIFESKNKNIEIKHINNRSGADVTSNLLKYDSVHGKFNAKINYNKNNIIINNNKITFSQEIDISKINWKKVKSTMYLNVLGKFNSKEKLLPYIRNGVKKLLYLLRAKMPIRLLFMVLIKIQFKRR